MSGRTVATASLGSVQMFGLPVYLMLADEENTAYCDNLTCLAQ